MYAQNTHTDAHRKEKKKKRYRNDFAHRSKIAKMKEEKRKTDTNKKKRTSNVDTLTRSFIHLHTLLIAESI